MEVYCHTCGDKRPMKQIRKPRNGRIIALLFFFLTIAIAVTVGFWPTAFIALILALVFAVTGKNYWKCEECGTLTQRV